MKYLTLGVLLFISFNYFGQYDKYEFQTGTYGCYLDISTYKELTLKEDSTFKFVYRGCTGSSDIYHGKWKVRKRKLILYDYEKNPVTLLVYTYSYSEFLVYTSLPFVIKYIHIRYKGNKTPSYLEKKTENSFSNEYDFEKQKTTIEELIKNVNIFHLIYSFS